MAGLMGARTRTRTAAVALLKAEPTLARIDGKGFEVYRAFPGPGIKRESIYIARTEGTGTVPYMEGGAHQLTDTFSLWFACQSVKAGQSAEEAEERVELFMDAIGFMVGRQHLPGGLLELVPDLGEVDLGEKNGPDSLPSGERTGFQGLGEVEVVCTAELFTVRDDD